MSFPRVTFFSGIMLAGLLAVQVAAAQEPPRGFSIPLIDLANETHRQVVVDKEDGQYLGHPTTDLLEDGQLMLVFPEGIEAIRKTVTQRYRLQRFRVGFVEQALRAGAPIIPTAIVGSADTQHLWLKGGMLRLRRFVRRLMGR